MQTLSAHLRITTWKTFFSLNCFQNVCCFLLLKVSKLPTTILYLPTQWAVFIACHCRDDCSFYEEACWGGSIGNSFQCTQNFWSVSVTWSSAVSRYYMDCRLICSSRLYIVIIWFPFVQFNGFNFVGLIWMFSHGRIIPGFKSCGMWCCAVVWVVPGVWMIVVPSFWRSDGPRRLNCLELQELWSERKGSNRSGIIMTL